MEKKSLPVIVWSRGAALSLRQLFEYINQESPAGAEKVRNGIIKIIEKLLENPEKYPHDQFRENNAGNYRAFEKYSYRIAYKYSLKEIIILRIRHVKREPKIY